MISPAAEQELYDYLDRLASGYGGDVVLGSSRSDSAHASYKGAKVDQLTKGWQPQLRSGDDALADSYPLLPARMRDLIRNEPSLGNAKRSLNKHVVRTGIQSFAEAIDGTGEPIDDYNFESDEWFERWCEEESDIEGKQSWQDRQWDLHDETVEVGNAFLLKCMSDAPGRTVPLAYQHVEAEQLDISKDQPATATQNKIVRGIEFDKNGRPIFYHFFDAHPYDSHSGWSSRSTPIPASRVIHNFIPFRPSMTQGVSWFHALIRATRDGDWLFGSELTSAALASLLVMIHKAKNPNATGGGMGFVGDGSSDSDTDAVGNSSVKWGRGIKATIGVDEDIKIAETSRPNRDVAPFIKFLRQEQAMGAGISYLKMTGDFSQTSFTSAHGAGNEDHAYILPLQMRFGRTVVAPIRREHMRLAVAYGLMTSVSATQFNRQVHRWTRLTIQPPGREQLDPVTQTDASTARMRAGLSSFKDECGALGINWRRQILQLKRERAYAAHHKVVLDFSKGASPPADGQVGDNTAQKTKNRQAAGEET